MSPSLKGWQSKTDGVVKMKEYKRFKHKAFKTIVVEQFLKLQKKIARQKQFNLIENRKTRIKNMTKACGKPCKNVQTIKVNLGGYDALFHTPAVVKNSDYVVLYLHGGAYIGSNIDIYNGFTSKFSHDMGLCCYSLEYPLAPEYPFPHAINAVYEFYIQMIEKGHHPSKIILAGDSAGAGLVVSAARRFKKEKISLPSALILFSPWVDLSMSGESIRTNIKNDLLLTNQLLENASKMYCSNAKSTDPAVSALFADFAGFPPVFLTATDDELLFSDSESLYERLVLHNVEVHYIVYHNMVHAFIVAANLFKESRFAMDDVKKFIDKLVKHGF